eukprot:s587_g24.t1
MVGHLTRKHPCVKVPRLLCERPSQSLWSQIRFRFRQGQEVGHLAAANIAPTARGLVIVTQEQAGRFLRDDKKISLDALALLTLSPIEAPPSCSLDCAALTWPGLLTATQEPLLMRGSCIQLGDVLITPKVGAVSDPTSVETDLFRVFVYRDQWPGDWKDLTLGDQRAGGDGSFGPCQVGSLWGESRGVTHFTDLTKTNKRKRDEVDTDEETEELDREYFDDTDLGPSRGTKRDRAISELFEDDQDYWSSSDQGRVWTRHHINPRSHLFSLKTLQKLSSASAPPDQDPWLAHDPWKGLPPASSAASAPATSSKLDEIESRLATKLAEQLQEQVKSLGDDNMDDSSRRLDQLEVSMQEMHAQQGKMNQWCHEAADKLTLVNQRVTQQEARLDEMNQQVSSNVAATEQLGHNLAAMQSSFKSDLQSAMEKQTSTLEAMLCKKLRVAQLSDVPMRDLVVPWRGHEYASGRAKIASFHFGATCVTGAVVYAPPTGPTYGDARALTAELLATITEELILGRQGPRYVAGDMNAATTDHVAFQHWRALGWIECQDWAHLHCNILPQPTCKHSTRPDHIWLSPELQRWVSHVTVSDEIFADHAVLQTHLCIPHDTGWQHSWPMPSVLPWADLVDGSLSFADQVPFSWTPMDLTSSFQTWSACAEQEIITAVSQHVHVPDGCRGRGQTLEVQTRPAALVPISPGRHGDVKPRSSLLGRLVHRWFQQLRRLQAHVRRAESGSLAPALQADQCATWKNIRQAKGFLPDFSTWPIIARLSGGTCVELPSDADPPQPGSKSQATAFLTQFEDIEKALHGLWEPIWRRHAGLAVSHWDRIVAFGRAFLPSQASKPCSWTSDHMHWVVQSYKKHATRGPDAWDRLDLIHLSPVRLGDLASLFACIEAGASWPRQLVTGFVCPIAKCVGAGHPTQFRPIVLLSLLYRMWASASAKAFLPTLLSMMPEHVFGYIPGKRATDLWSLLQLAIDVAGVSQQALVGYNADLIKCFNRLPRHPLLTLLVHLGLPVDTMHAWQRALDGLERRFRINSDVGPKRMSETGFPEGDPLSCVAMLGFNLVFDLYVRQYAPDCIPFGFVDNLQLVSHAAASLHAGTLVVESFMDAWDLSLDPHKSYTWALTSSQRAALKAMGHLVKLASKDLGAQMHYSQKPCREVLKLRIDSIAHFWTFLRHSSASSWFRRHVIRVAAWPKVLHSCESAWISDSTLDSLRSKCMYAMKWDRAGASPLVRWALMQPLGDDPAFGQLWRVFESFWRLAQQYAFVRMAWTFSVFEKRLNNGFLHAFHAALAAVDWTLDERWLLSGPWFTLHWDSLTLADLKMMLAEAWRQTVCARLAHRKDFQGLPNIDVEVSFGSFKPRDKATSELAAVAAWSGAPRAFTDHALVGRNPFLLDHWRNLLTMDSTLERFYVSPPAGTHVHVFTDGSCKEPRSRVKALAAWAVIDMATNRVVSTGMVPGLTQSSDVAELLAAISALCWALRHRISICIHSDSSYVVDGLRGLHHLQHVPKKWKHQALWKQTLELLQQLDSAQWDVHKIYSHCDYQHAASSLEEWWIVGNATADANAARAFDLAPLSFLQTYKNLCEHHDLQTARVQQQLAFLLAIARFELEHRISVNDDDEDVMISSLLVPREICDRSLADQFDLDVLDALTVQSVAPFPLAFSKSLHSFLLDLDMTATHARYVTGIELMAGFLASGSRIPIQRFVEGILIYDDPVDICAGGLIRLTIATVLKTFKLAVLKFLKSAEVQFSATMDRLVEERRVLIAQRRREWAKKANAHCGDEEGGTEKAAEVALPEDMRETLSWFQSITRCFRKCGLGEQQLTTLMFTFLNVIVFAIGFISNLEGGFQKSLAFPCAKVAGRDATEDAERAHGNSRKAKSLMSKYCIGTLAVEQFNGQTQNGKVMSLEELADAANAGPQIPVGKMVALEHLGNEAPGEGSVQTAPAVPLDDLAKTPKKVMALDDFGDGTRVGPNGPGGPSGPSVPSGPSFPLDDLAKTPKKVMALDDFGDGTRVGPNGPSGPSGPSLGLPPARKMVALEELGKDPEPRTKMVALEELGKEESNGKKVVKLEELGEDPSGNNGYQLFARGTRTGRKRTLEAAVQEKPTEQAQEEVNQEVDPEEDETKAHVRILLASWALANQKEGAVEEAILKESEGQSSDESDKDQPVVTSGEKTTSRWQRMKGNFRSSLEWRNDKKAKKEEKNQKKTADDDSPEGQEESVQALIGRGKKVQVFSSVQSSCLILIIHPQFCATITHRTLSVLRHFIVSDFASANVCQPLVPMTGSKVPTSYAEMFDFNATVMGFGKHKWLAEVNRSFDDIVKNAAKLDRLQEETEVLALRIGKTAEGEVTLSMNLREVLSKPRVWQPELARLMARYSDKEKEAMRDEVYVRFFQVAPSGQEYFKQMTELISALGLRHVGYGIPTELVGPFANCFVEVLRENAPGEDAALEGFEWSIKLVAKILIRVIQEGSTIVMKAINANSALQLRKAIALAPRGERAQWLLCIQVGTQRISPLSWSIESGSIEAARAMIQDLLTIRADRDRYYYGVDALFQAHPDIVERLCSDAIQLLGTLLDGLVWRSKRTINSARRVNFYIKHLVVREGKFAGALNAICVAQDVKIISNQVLVLLSDTLWAGVVRRQFVLSKVGFLFSLVVFMLSQAILPKIETADELNMRIAVFAGRSINYGFSMLRLLLFHWRRIYKAYRTGAVTKGRCPVPLYLKDEDARMGLLLLLLLMAMCASEPMFYCAYEIPVTGPSEKCPEGQGMMQVYIILSMAAMVLHWLLVINLSVFATKLAAFVLVIREVFGEVGKFMVAIIFILITFSSAIASLRHDVAELSTLPKAANCLFATTVGIYEGDYREMLHQPALLGAVFMFITVSAILLINLLIAQLNLASFRR